jgi:hypothetical protein
VTFTYNEIAYNLLKNKEIMTHATAWINLEDAILSKVSQIQKDNYYITTLLYEVSRVVKFTRMESSTMLTRV